MNLKRFLTITSIIISFSFSQCVIGKESFPKVTGKVYDFYPTKMTSLSDFKVQDEQDQKKYSGLWSNLNSKINLNSLKVTITSSIVSTQYPCKNLFDGKPETTWVEGAKSNGIGEWIKVKLEAKKDSPSSTPFSISEIGMIPGYAKSTKTWLENNRVKTILFGIYSTEFCAPQENKWVFGRLHFKDQNRLQIFDLEKLHTINDTPMTKTVWCKIEEVYPGTKFNDTCISEIVITGGCLP